MGRLGEVPLPLPGSGASSTAHDDPRWTPRRHAFSDPARAGDAPFVDAVRRHRHANPDGIDPAIRVMLDREVVSYHETLRPHIDRYMRALLAIQDILLMRALTQDPVSLTWFLSLIPARVQLGRRD